MSIDLAGDRATVTLAQEQVALDRDLVLLVTPSEAIAPQIVLERTRTGRVAAAVTFRPQFDAARVPADVVFVVDRSGSMQGSSIEQVRNALQICLRSLEAGCSFNILGFGSRFESRRSPPDSVTDGPRTGRAGWSARRQLSAQLAACHTVPGALDRRGAQPCWLIARVLSTANARCGPAPAQEPATVLPIRRARRC
jgi:von Willebrand factor type A domain